MGERDGDGELVRLLRERIELDDPLAGVVSQRCARPLEQGLGLRTVHDLVMHLPRRYAQRGQLMRLESLTEGEHVTVVAEIVRVEERRMVKRRGSRLQVVVRDGTSDLLLTFFNQSWRRAELREGARGMFSGKVSVYAGRVQLMHPAYQLFEGEPGGDPIRPERWASELVPIYPATAKLSSWNIGRVITSVLEHLDGYPDPVPPELRARYGQVPMWDALRALHAPRDLAQVRAARQALRYGEAFVLQAALLQQRARSRAVPGRPRVRLPGGLLERFDASLPFELTGDQRIVGEDIARELAREVPMHRLVQGEVGSGKTLVAVRAMLQVADGGGQSALLAPTEVLAHQHLRSIEEQLGPELRDAVRPVLLTGGMPQAERRRALVRIAAGDARIVVGTHALLGDAVSFPDLGLVVVDEQHRFGVEQRDALRGKGSSPHLLVLTATPIPRTVAMTVFGDLDVSTIAQLPGGRAGISSHVVPWGDKPAWVERVWSRLAEELAAGRQAFVVCPAIEAGEQAGEGEHADAGERSGAGKQGHAGGPRDAAGRADAGERAAAAGHGHAGGYVDAGAQGEASPPPPGPFGAGPASVEVAAAVLARLPALRGRRIEIVHGRMPADEKDAVMRAFAAGEVDVLVATTVIEVGVNVPNASLMIVADADRFGVSQLHQLRGRVGRGEHAGLCLLMTSAPAGSVARERVESVASTLDGFVLAELDLEARREGDVLGTAQSGGRTSLRLLRVAEHGELIRLAREDAALLVDEDAELARWPALHRALHRLRGEHVEALGRG